MRDTVVSPATTVGGGGGVVGGSGGVKSVELIDGNMGISWRRLGTSQTSILRYFILFIIVVPLITEARPPKEWGHRKRHRSSGNRRSVGPEWSMTPTHRRSYHNDRAVRLTDAMNLTVCSYSVREDVVEERVPKVIQHVRCVENGCRCKVVGNTGTYACTQLSTNMLVTINDQQIPYEVYYACVCASKSGVEVTEKSPQVLNR